jgi:hypothetical protein
LYSLSFGKLSAAFELLANNKLFFIAFIKSIRKSLDSGILTQIYAANYVTRDCNIITQRVGENINDDKCLK